MKSKKIWVACLVLVICLASFTRCGRFTPSMQTNLSYTQVRYEMLPILSDAQMVGPREASHGAAQYQQIDAAIFRAFVENNGCWTVRSERDFSSALTIDRYINGEDDSAEKPLERLDFPFIGHKKWQSYSIGYDLIVKPHHQHSISTAWTYRVLIIARSICFPFNSLF